MYEHEIVHHLTTDLGVVQNSESDLFQRLSFLNAVNGMQIEVMRGITTETSPRTTTVFVFDAENLTIGHSRLDDDIDERYRDLVTFTFQMDENKWMTFNFYMHPNKLREAVASMTELTVSEPTALEWEDINENS